MVLRQRQHERIGVKRFHAKVLSHDLGENNRRARGR
jgi:hypothetical protein